MGWVIDVQGARLAEEDVKAAHVSVVNATLGATGWDSLDPLSSPEALIVWCAVACAAATGRDLEEALIFVQNMPMQEVISYYHAEAPAESPPVVERVAPRPDGNEEWPKQNPHLEAFVAAAKG